MKITSVDLDLTQGEDTLSIQSDHDITTLVLRRGFDEARLAGGKNAGHRGDRFKGRQAFTVELGTNQNVKI